MLLKTESSGGAVTPRSMTPKGLTSMCANPITRICSADSCKRQSHARGMCKLHYNQWLRNSKPNIIQITPSVEERFWSRVRKSRECWVWVAADNGVGYGMMAVNGRNQLAHRVSYVLHFGQIPDGLIVCHRCDNPACVRPDHLFLGTTSDNLQDMHSKGRGFDNRGSNNPNALLTEQGVLEIREAFSKGDASMPEMAETYGVSISLIGNVIRGDVWRHVTHGTNLRREPEDVMIREVLGQ